MHNLTVVLANVPVVTSWSAIATSQVLPQFQDRVCTKITINMISATVRQITMKTNFCEQNNVSVKRASSALGTLAGVGEGNLFPSARCRSADRARHSLELTLRTAA